MPESRAEFKVCIDSDAVCVLRDVEGDAAPGGVERDEGPRQSVAIGRGGEVLQGDAFGRDPVFDRGVRRVEHAMTGSKGAGDKLGLLAADDFVAAPAEVGKVADALINGAPDGEVGTESKAWFFEFHDFFAVVDATEQVGAALAKPGRAFDGFPPKLNGTSDDVGRPGVEDIENSDEPVFFDPDIVIKEGEYIAGCFGHRAVAGVGEAEIGFDDATGLERHGWGDLGNAGDGVVAAAVGDDEKLNSGVRRNNDVAEAFEGTQ